MRATTEIPDNNTIVQAGREEIQIEVEALSRIASQLDDSFADAMRAILDCHGKVFVSGSGTSSAVARRAAHLLSVAGTPSVFIHAMDALHGSVGAITSDDILLAFSKGGGSTELNDLLAAARRRGAIVIAVTESPDSKFAGEADIVATISTDAEADPGGMMGMGSTLSAALWADALTRVSMRLRGRSWDEVLEVHPAGAVGSHGLPHVPLPQPVTPGFDQEGGRQ